MSLLCQLCCLFLGINRERKGESDYLWELLSGYGRERLNSLLLGRERLNSLLLGRERPRVHDSRISWIGIAL